LRAPIGALRLAIFFKRARENFFPEKFFHCSKRRGIFFVHEARDRSSLFCLP
jgi:hypothetical protein